MSLRPLLLSVPIALLLVGCGGDDGDGGPAPYAGDTPSATASTTSTASPTATPTPSATPTRTPSKAPTRTPSGTPPATSAPATPAAPATDPALRRAAQAYSDAWLTGNAPAAFDLLSERCKDRVDMQGYGDDAIAAGRKYGEPQPIATYSADITGVTAVLAFTFDGSAPAHEAERWVRERGYWHLDEC